jgi:hypothetical protein
MRLAEALQQLRPAAEWVAYGDTYADIIWLDTKQDQPSQAEVEALIGE